MTQSVPTPMMNLQRTALAALLGALLLLPQGCDVPHRVDHRLSDPCGGYTCPAVGVKDGNFAISGSINIDPYFLAVTRLDLAVRRAQDNMRSELDAIALALGLEQGASGPSIHDALQAKLSANLTGKLKITVQKAQCKSSTIAAALVTANCDPELAVDDAAVWCFGECEPDAIEAGEAQCEENANTTCVGTAPRLECTGMCQGTCIPAENSSCEGICSGQCGGVCSNVAADGSCHGSCTDRCVGSCDLPVGATCNGKCLGECTYAAVDAQCASGTITRCDNGDRGVECTGTCAGQVQPRKGLPECRISARAEGAIAAECPVPGVSLAYQLSPELAEDPEAQFAIVAWLNVVKDHLSKLAAAQAKAKHLSNATAYLRDSASGPLKTTFSQAANSNDASLEESIGASCAFNELREVDSLLEQVSDSLAERIAASDDIFDAFED